MKTPEEAGATVPASDADVDELAKTLADEHEAATAAVSRTAGDPDSLPEQIVLAAPYADQGELGRGGMGAVRRALDGDLQRQVAVKVILPSLSSNPAHAARFVQEARITALLDHPNVAPVHRLATGPDGSLSLVMKLVEGRTLTSYVRQLPPPPWPPEILDSILSIFVKICDAVAFAHSRGVIHLDLKPDNIMVGAFGQVYVMDWGIARYRPKMGQPSVLQVERRPDAPMGTPAYMSPEQAMRKEKDLDERTDVYLLGGILYEILTGHRPHEGYSLIAILSEAIAGFVKAPALRAPARPAPPALAAIAMRALDGRPFNRYQSVLDLQRDVVAFQRGEERSPQRMYAAGDVVVREGEPGNEAFVIVSGRCAVTTRHEGRRVVLRELGPGDVFGETAVFAEEPRSASVEAIEHLVVRVVTGETLSQTLGLQTWTGEFVKALAERFREADRRARQLGPRG